MATTDATSQARGDNLPLGILFAVISVFFFGVMAVFVKKTGEAGYPISQVLFFRNLGALPVLAAVIAQSGGLSSLHTRHPLRHLMRSTIGLIAMALVFSSMTLLPLADATALMFAAPLFITTFSVPLLGERVGMHRWTAVLIGFAGVAVMAQPTGEISTLGLVVALGGAFFQAMAMITVRYLNRTESPAAIIGYFTVFILVLSAIACVFMGWRPPSGADLAMLLALGLCGGTAQYFLTLSYRKAPAALIGLFNYSSILWATLFGFVFFDDVPALPVVGGAAVVIASGSYITYREVARHRRVRAVDLPET